MMATVEDIIDDFHDLALVAQDRRDDGSDLPLDVLHRILHFVAVGGGQTAGFSLLAASAVCRRWNECVNCATDAWRTVCVNAGLVAVPARDEDGEGGGEVARLEICSQNLLRQGVPINLSANHNLVDTKHLRALFVRSIAGGLLKKSGTTARLRIPNTSLVSQRVQPISGQVMVRVSEKAVAIKSVTVTLEGKESAMLLDNEGGTKRIGHQYFKKSIELPLTEQYGPGLHFLPFNAIFPPFGDRGEVLPPSTQTSTVKVIYTVSAHVHFDDRSAIDQGFLTALRHTVLMQDDVLQDSVVMNMQSAPTHSLSPVGIEGRQQSKVDIFGKRLALRIQVPSSQLRVGTTVPIQVSVCNHTSNDLDHIKLDLKLNFDWRSSVGNPAHQRVRVPMVDFVIVKSARAVAQFKLGGVLSPIPAGTSATRTVDFSIPVALDLPAVSTTKFMSVSYTLRATASASRSTCTVDLPVEIVS